MLTPILTAASALVSWQLAAFVVPLVACIAYCLVAERNTRRRWRIEAARAEENRKAVAHFALCTTRRDLLHCQRVAGHEGLHAHTLPSGRVVSWPQVAGLERLLRAVDGDGAA